MPASHFMHPFFYCICNYMVCQIVAGPALHEPYQPDCAAYDFATEVNEDVDLLDFAGLQRRGFDQP